MPTSVDLASRQCVPCGSGVVPLAPSQIAELLKAVPSWNLTADGKRIRREWRVRDFATAIDFFQRILPIAEAEDHHPDLHVAGYRNVLVEIWTHAVNGLTENDFILAAKLDTLKVELKAG